MKNYYFNPNDYDQTYTVTANSAQEALDRVKVYVTERPRGDYFYRYNYNKWINVTLGSLPRGYTIDEYDIQDVIPGEVS